ILNVIDEGNREALAIEIGTSIPSARVIRVMDDLIRLHGRPARVRIDNGPELTAEAFVDWCTAQRIGLGYIHPGKPHHNAFIERFNRTFREEVLDASLFDSLDQVRAIAEAWLAIYNTERPHDSLGQVPPLTFLPRPDAPVESTFTVSTWRGSLRRGALRIAGGRSDREGHAWSRGIGKPLVAGGTIGGR